MVLEASPDALPSLTLHAQCEHDTDLDVQARRSGEPLADTAQRVIARFVQTCLREQAGTVRLGEARLSWTMDKPC